MNNRIKIRFIKEGELKMDVNNLTVIIALINLVIFIAIPIGIVIFIINIVKNQKKMKSDIDLFSNSLNLLFNKSISDFIFF